MELFLADAAAIKVSFFIISSIGWWLMRSKQEVSSSRHLFPKPVYRYVLLTIFGRNIVASEGDEWKRFRKITAPAFSDVSLMFAVIRTASVTFSPSPAQQPPCVE